MNLWPCWIERFVLVVRDYCGNIFALIKANAHCSSRSISALMVNFFYLPLIY